MSSLPLHVCPSSDDDDDDIEDDEDAAWKVRKACCRLLSTMTALHAAFVAEHFGSISSALLPRFREREESVRADVFNTYAALLGLLAELRGPTYNA